MARSNRSGRSVSRNILEHIAQGNESSDEEPKTEAQQLDKLLHRLPDDYFVKDDDEEDMNMVMSNI